MASSSWQTSAKDHPLAINNEQELVAIDEITEDEDNCFLKMEPLPAVTFTAANSRLTTFEESLLFFRNQTRGPRYQYISQVSNNALSGRALPCIRAQTLNRFNAFAAITALQWYLKSIDDEDLDKSFQDIDIEMQSVLRSVSRDRDGHRETTKLGKTFLCLTAQAGATLMGFGLNSSSSRALLLLYFVVAANMLGFLGSLAGILLRHKSKMIAGIMEAIGSVFAAFGFFGMTAIFLPQNFIWVSGLGCVAILAIYALAFTK